MLLKLNADNHRFAVALARLPDDIRGFGPVKEASVKKVEATKADLMNQFSSAKPATPGKKAKAAEPAE